MRAPEIFLVLLCIAGTQCFHHAAMSEDLKISAPGGTALPGKRVVRAENTVNNIIKVMKEMKTDLGKCKKDQARNAAIIDVVRKRSEENFAKCEQNIATQSRILESNHNQMKMYREKSKRYDQMLTSHSQLLEQCKHDLADLHTTQAQLSSSVTANSQKLETLEEEFKEPEEDTELSKSHETELKELDTLVTDSNEPEEYTVEDAELSKAHQAACQSYSSVGYIYNKAADFCFKVHQEMATWEQALMICQQEGGTLAKADTDARWTIVEEIVKGDGTVDYYIGGTDKGEDGVWRWVADNSVIPGFTEKGHKQCLEVDRHEQDLDDSGCNMSQQKFICEIMAE